MTISSSTRKAGPYTGTGTTATYPFAFKIFQASDLLVVKTTPAGVESTLALTTDYTVSLNADQNSSPGGSITLVAGNLASNYKVTMTSQVPETQTTDLTNQGGFYPQVITNALDKLTIIVQQLQLGVDRSAKLPISSTADADTLSAAIVLLADDIANIDAVASDLTNIDSVAGNTTNINNVASNSTNIAAVGSNISSITAVAGNATNINAVNANKTNIDTVAGNSANITTVAGISTNVTSVAGNSTNIDTVATNITAVNNVSTNMSSVTGAVTQANNAATSATAAAGSATAAASSASSASTSASTATTQAATATTQAGIATTQAGNASTSATNAASSATAAASSASAASSSATSASSSASSALTQWNNFQGQYYGSYATNPTVDPLGAAIGTGDLYWNTTVPEMRVYNGTTWVPVSTTPDTIAERSFLATAGQTSYTFTGGYRVNYTYVFVNGAMLYSNEYTATDGTTITFAAALALNDEVRILTFKAVGSVAIADIVGLQTQLDTINSTIAAIPNPVAMALVFGS